MANTSFYKRFGLELTLEEAKEKFVKRINISIFDKIEKKNIYDEIFRRICLELGEDPDCYITMNGLLSPHSNTYKNIKYLTKNDFEKTKHVLEFIPCDPNIIISCINKSIENDGIDLGITFINGKFNKKGNDQLDQDILSKSFDKLEGSKAKKIWGEALEEYLKGDYDDTLGKCFTTLDELFNEKFGKKFNAIFKSKTISEGLGLEKELSKYWDGLESNIGGTKTIERGIIQNLYVYLNEYSIRHANGGKYNINETEAEATLYLTGVIINLVTNLSNK